MQNIFDTLTKRPLASLLVIGAIGTAAAEIIEATRKK